MHDPDAAAGALTASPVAATSTSTAPRWPPRRCWPPGLLPVIHRSPVQRPGCRPTSRRPAPCSPASAAPTPTAPASAARPSWSWATAPPRRALPASSAACRCPALRWSTGSLLTVADVGGIAYDATGLQDANEFGIDSISVDQWRRASTQAILGLGLPAFDSITAAGADPELPAAPTCEPVVNDTDYPARPPAPRLRSSSRPRKAAGPQLVNTGVTTATLPMTITGIAAILIGFGLVLMARRTRSGRARLMARQVVRALAAFAAGALLTLGFAPGALAAAGRGARRRTSGRRCSGGAGQGITATRATPVRSPSSSTSPESAAASTSAARPGRPGSRPWRTPSATRRSRRSRASSARSRAHRPATARPPRPARRTGRTGRRHLAAAGPTRAADSAPAG